jgi:hypothetical protein
MNCTWTAMLPFVYWRNLGEKKRCIPCNLSIGRGQRENHQVRCEVLRNNNHLVINFLQMKNKKELKLLAFMLSGALEYSKVLSSARHFTWNKRWLLTSALLALGGLFETEVFLTELTLELSCISGTRCVVTLDVSVKCTKSVCGLHMQRNHSQGTNNNFIHIHLTERNP